MENNLAKELAESWGQHNFPVEECLRQMWNLADGLEAELRIIALRLLGEDESTFSPETKEVMDRWKPRLLEMLDASR